MLENLAVTIVTVVITALVGYLFAIPQIKRQLEADLKKESESIKQQFQVDLQKEYNSRFNERKWETYEHFADIIRRLMESVGNK
jgi:predicted Holliday junction resolvase-like endonuclease